MRVLVISHLFPGPAEPTQGPYIAEQVRALRRHADVFVVCGVTGARSDETGRVDGTPVAYVRVPRFAFLPRSLAVVARTPFYLRAVRRAIAKERFDLVHAHYAAPDGLVGVRLAKSLHVPCVVTLHGSDANVQLRRPLLGAAAARLLEGASRIVCVSERMRLGLAAARPRLAAKLVTLANGYAADELEFHRDEDRTDLLFVGGLRPVKNLDVLLEAYAAIAPEIPAGLVIAGDGELRSELESSVAEKGLGDRVRFLGQVGHSSLQSLFDRAVALVLPSRSEGMPIVVLEALATGTPIVASDVGGISEVVTDERFGTLVPPGDVGALSAAMRDAVERGWDHAGIATEAPIASWDQNAEALAGLYREAGAGEAAGETKTAGEGTASQAPTANASSNHSELTLGSARSFVWRTLGSIAVQPVTTLTTIVLARLLVPSDFGLIAMCTVLIEVAQIGNEFGFSHALIQKKALTTDEVASVFWLNMIIGVLFFLAAALASPAVAALYKQPVLLTLFPVMSIGFILSSASQVQHALSRRAMRFGPVAAVGVLTAAVQGAVSIVLALLGKGVWGLAIGYIAGQVAAWVFWQVRTGFWPRPRLRLDEVRYVLDFGTATMTSDLATKGLGRLDTVVVGRGLGAGVLGGYGLAFNLMMFPSRTITQAVLGVTLPAFSRIQDDVPRFRGAYRRALELTALLGLPVLAASAIAGREVIVGLYGQKWEFAAVAFQVMCLGGMVRAISSLTGVVFRAMGRPRVETAWSLAGVAILLIAVAVGTRWGIVGVSAALTLASLLAAVPMLAAANRLVSLPTGAFVRAMLPGAAAAMLSAAIALPLRNVSLAMGLPTLVTAVLSVGVALLVTWLVARNVPLFSAVRGFESLLVETLKNLRLPSSAGAAVAREP